MTDPSADDYPTTWGGVLLCCTYTGMLTVRFLIEALLCPLLRCLSMCCVVVTGFVRTYSVVFMMPMVLLWKLFAIARRRWRHLTWRHQAICILGFLIYGACCVLRLLVWLVSWVQHRSWWCALDNSVLYIATLLPIAVPSVLTAWRCMSRLGFRAVLTLRDIGHKPVLLPINNRPLPKMCIWWAHVQVARFYRANLPRQLLQCYACYLLLVSSNMVNTSPMALTHLLYEVMRNTAVRQTQGFARMPQHGEDVHVTHCTSSNTPRFMPNVRRGKVTAVYDGDTLTVAARHNREGMPYRFSVRLSGIDAPEIRGAASADEKRAAIAARDALRTAILGELVTLTVHNFDKYGRLLASVAHDHKGDMSHWMLETGYARPYNGGKREKWEMICD